MTVSAIEYSRIGPNKLTLYAMKCTNCEELSPWWEKNFCYKCNSSELVEQQISDGGTLANYTVVYYPPREFVGQEPYVVGHINMDDGVVMPAPIVDISADQVKVGMRVKSTLRRMKLGHEGDVYYSQKFVVDEPIDDGAATKKKNSPRKSAKKPKKKK